MYKYSQCQISVRLLNSKTSSSRSWIRFENALNLSRRLSSSSISDFSCNNARLNNYFFLIRRDFFGKNLVTLLEKPNYSNNGHEFLRAFHTSYARNPVELCAFFPSSAYVSLISIYAHSHLVPFAAGPVI